MKGSIKKPVFRMTFCAAVAALELVLMMASSLFRIGTYALPCLAGFFTVAVVIEYRCKWAFGVYAVTALLSFFLSGDKEAVVLFIALFGYYPILKNIIERFVHSAFLRWVIKFSVFNAAAVGSFYIAMLLLGVPDAEYTVFGVYIPHVFLLAGNVFFLLYDLSINVFVKFYVQRIRIALFGRYL